MRRLAGLLLCVAGCSRIAPSAPPPVTGFAPTPTRGIVLISIDTLRADHLGAYGYAEPTSPFLDRLAARGVLFERAYAQYPGTLQSHMSIFTGLYPGEHDVMPPAYVLSPAIATLPELLTRAGFRTSGHSEGGWMSGGFGFRRGFADWTDHPYVADTDIERTLGLGLAFLRSVPAEQRFFLFLHTYSVHDPYRPPQEYVERFWKGAPPHGMFPPDGPAFSNFNREKLVASPEQLAYLRALYDASIAYVDHQLEGFWGEVERLGLADETTLVVTSDHGEEFAEHGLLAHTQVYPECLHVPLLVVHPARREPLRIPPLVELIDLAPTLLELAGAPLPQMSGRSLLPLLSDPSAAHRGRAYAEVRAAFGIGARTMIEARGDELWQLVHVRPEQEIEGFWVTKQIRFDSSAAHLELQAVAFHEPRTVTVEVDGRARPPLALVPDWRTLVLDLPDDGELHRITLSTTGCTSPLAVGASADDTRCLSFKLRGVALDRIELFELVKDPAAARDLARHETSRTRALTVALKGFRHLPVAPASQETLTAEHVRQLQALGFLH